MEHLVVWHVWLLFVLLGQLLFLNTVKHFAWPYSNLFLTLLFFFCPPFNFHIVWSCLLDIFISVLSSTCLQNCSSLIGILMWLTRMNGQKCCFTNFKTRSGFCLLFILKMSLFRDVIFEDFFTKELKSLLNHFFGWIKNTFYVFNKL